MQQAKGNREGASKGDENQRQCGKHLESLWGESGSRNIETISNNVHKNNNF